MADARTEKADTTLTVHEREALDAIAIDHGVSRAGMVRLILLGHLAEHAPTAVSYGLVASVPDVARECRLARARLAALPEAVETVTKKV